MHHTKCLWQHYYVVPIAENVQNVKPVQIAQVSYFVNFQQNFQHLICMHIAVVGSSNKVKRNWLVEAQCLRIIKEQHLIVQSIKKNEILEQKLNFYKIVVFLNVH